MEDVDEATAGRGGERTVSVVIPARNEERYIAATLEHVLGQDHPAALTEVCIVDGASEDDTIEVARRTAAAAGRPFRVCTDADIDEPLWGGVRIVPNPRRVTPVAFNEGVRHSAGDVIIIIGGHSEVRPDYVSQCLRVLAETGASGVGGWCETVGADERGRTMAAAQSSVIGVGNAYYRTIGAERRTVDTVPFPAYPRTTFERFGLFDEELIRNQDDEFNFRIRQGGGTLVFDPAIRSRYVVRPSLRKLFSQYRQYGYYRIVVMRKRRAVAAGRHLAPMGFVAAAVLAVLMTLVTRKVRFAAAVLGPYLLATGGESVRLTRQSPSQLPTALGALAALHWGYGIGQWQAVLKGEASQGHRSTPPSHH